MAKEEKKVEQQEIENKEQNKEDSKDKKRTLKTVIISVISTLLFIIILLLIVLLCLKNCSKHNNDNLSNNNSGNSGPHYNYDNELLDDKFKRIVNYERLYLGYEEEPTKVISIIYEDNYPNSFSLAITASSLNTVYNYRIIDYSYTGDKLSYDNMISYILSIDINNRLDGDATLSGNTLMDLSINTSRSTYKYIISKSLTDNYYLSGFYYENNEFFIFNNRLYFEGNDPFLGVGDQKVTIEDPLYGYYQRMMKA